MTKTILITGATSGFGRAAVHRFANAGWRVIATGRRIERLEALAAEWPPGHIHITAFDMRDSATLHTAIQTLPADFADIDVLVNNAGLALGTAPAQHTDLAQWREMIDTNITSLVTLTHHLLPTLIERKGMIINISSVAATYPYTGGNVYAGTKAFVKQFSLGLRSDLHGTGTRDQHRTRDGRNRVHPSAYWRQPNRFRRTVSWRQPDHSRRYCRANLLHRHTTAASQHQSAGNHVR